MAQGYALRYFKTYDLNGHTVRLNIYKKYPAVEYAPAAKEIGRVLQGLSLDVQGEQDDIISPIVKTSLSMTFADAPGVEEGKKTGDWEEFYTPDSTAFKVLLYIDGSLYWSGYITPDSFEEDLEYHGSVTLVARDNIGHLQDFQFDASGNNDETMISVREIINGAWSKVECLLSLNYASGGDVVWPICEGYTALDCLVNVEAFDDKNWFEALSDVLDSFGLVLRFVGYNKAMVMPLRALPCLDQSYLSAVEVKNVLLQTAGHRMLTPACKSIVDTVNYDQGPIDEFNFTADDYERVTVYAEAIDKSHIIAATEVGSAQLEVLKISLSAGQKVYIKSYERLEQLVLYYNKDEANTLIDQAIDANVWVECTIPVDVTMIGYKVTASTTVILATFLSDPLYTWQPVLASGWQRIGNIGTINPFEFGADPRSGANYASNNNLFVSVVQEVSLTNYLYMQRIFSVGEQVLDISFTINGVFYSASYGGTYINAGSARQQTVRFNYSLVAYICDDQAQVCGIKYFDAETNTFVDEEKYCVAELSYGQSSSQGRYGQQSIDVRHSIVIPEGTGIFQVNFHGFTANVSEAGAVQRPSYTPIQDMIDAGRAYCKVSNFVMEQSEAAQYKYNKLTSVYDESYNMMITREPALGTGPLVLSPKVIRNGIYLPDSFYTSAQKWYWPSGEESSLQALIAQQILMYYSQPNSIITGTLLALVENNEILDFNCLWHWRGRQLALISGQLDLMTGFIESAKLREFKMWSEVWPIEGLLITESESYVNTEDNKYINVGK